MAKINNLKDFNTNNLDKKTLEELLMMQKSVHLERQKLKLDLKMGKLKNVHRVKHLRKKIAQIKTEIRRREFLE